MNISKGGPGQTLKACNRLDDSRCNERDRSRIIYDSSCSNDLDLEKCDQENFNLPSYVAIYAKEIFEYLQDTQVCFKFTYKSNIFIAQI